LKRYIDSFQDREEVLSFSSFFEKSRADLPHRSHHWKRRNEYKTNNLRKEGMYLPA